MEEAAVQVAAATDAAVDRAPDVGQAEVHEQSREPARDAQIESGDPASDFKLVVFGLKRRRVRIARVVAIVPQRVLYQHPPARREQRDQPTEAIRSSLTEVVEHEAGVDHVEQAKRVQVVGQQVAAAHREPRVGDLVDEASIDVGGNHVAACVPHPLWYSKHLPSPTAQASWNAGLTTLALALSIGCERRAVHGEWRRHRMRAMRVRSRLVKT